MSRTYNIDGTHHNDKMIDWKKIKHIRFCSRWRGRNSMGKYWKNKLNKAWRQYYKRKLQGGSPRMPVVHMSRVDWKGW